MSRYKASLIHLIGSAFVLSVVFLLISQVWYPGVLFTKSAGIKLLTIVATVDLVVGPLITLIIFDVKKNLIKMDMAIILVCQICFMSYGMWTVFASRPVYIAFTGTNFYMVKANEIEKSALKQVQTEQFKHLPLFGPEFVGTKQPDDLKTRNDLVFAGAAGMGIQNLPQYYVPLVQVQKQIIAVAKKSQQFILIEPETKRLLAQYEKNHSSIPASFVLLSYRGFSLFVAVNAKTGEVIEII
jgi:hypothetical protein